MVGNAIKFTEQGGVRIVVGILSGGSRTAIEYDDVQDSSYSGDAIRIQIIDTGIGITEEQQEKIFQPFAQGDGTVARNFGGTGLGLVISRRLARMLGGDISAFSEPGSGSTFTLTIAAHEATGHDGDSADDVSASKPLAIEATEQIELRCHVLIVDDSRNIRFLSKRILTKAGAQVTEAEDGEGAIDVVTQALNESNVFDMVLLDMQMPKLDGYQTARRLRELGFAGPIIALTADAMHGDMNRCIESGCNDYLSKPIDTHLLLNVAHRLTS